MLTKYVNNIYEIPVELIICDDPQKMAPNHDGQEESKSIKSF